MNFFRKTKTCLNLATDKVCLNLATDLATWSN